MAKDAQRELNQRTFASLGMVMKAIVELLGPGSEVVLHDMSDPDSSIVAIEGDVTGRCVGGPLTDSGLRCLRSPDSERVYSYTTVAEGGRVIKSASVFLSDEKGHLFGGLCINLDITPYLAFDRHLQTLLRPANDGASAQTFGSEVEEVLDAMVKEAIAGTGIPVSLMQKSERLRVIRALDDKGAFLLKKAVPLVAERLGVSRHTVYGDLGEIEETKEMERAEATEEGTS